ncbi:flagellar basal body rod protein FlgC [Acetobacter nitrogenifigens DSM 23921 = NBRC 105050]|uniref:Flagellar basal-body rod protein FlgC n=1 Tax=Acetobacter nitrogenifigens DSM 23921 = NBRC 105050 TaxID=1120919 RepID=A0A511XBA0_9PROT|nr:flagellar basal body rod protein FlgC [Acetobacter nitrogenifigens]GBQ92986.1 flagellar basal body rod protein FlgC [Acetobacter nitrogenifigens DSM 23921 = NBRC 105050]GEN60185.1 flagellar basal-body rod protein FlgC [Acetobacter nitrogenifigens DSM 23921 = NBRC 105050]
MDMTSTLNISAAGMDAQSQRLRVVAENLANQDTTGSTPGADPYRRKTITFQNEVDRQSGVPTVRVKKIGQDMSDFETEYDPSHPAADARGYVKKPNVNTMVEVMDAHEAQRSYEANLNTLQATRSMMTRAIDLLK